MGTARCASCREPVGGTARVVIPEIAVQLCLGCVTTMGKAPGTPATTQRFVEWYISTHRPMSDAQQVERLREELAFAHAVLAKHNIEVTNATGI